MFAVGLMWAVEEYEGGIEDEGRRGEINTS